MPAERERTTAFLDDLQAAERVGADALHRWAACCREPLLRVVLQVAAARDAAHADLAADRLRALGGSPSAAAGRGVIELSRTLASPDVSDRSKLSVLLARFPASATDPFADYAHLAARDPETRALLDTIADDERVTLDGLRRVQAAAPVAGAAEPSASDRAVAIDVLDALLAAERAAADVFAAWLAVCDDATLRGGLRTIVRREATHAVLAADRLAALGATARAALAGDARAAATAVFGDAGVASAAKLDALLARYPDDADAGSALHAAAAGLSSDAATRVLLELVATTESATIGWLRRYRRAL